MKITLKREPFIEALEKVKPAVPTKTNLPILAYFLLQAKGGKISVIGQNLSIALIASCPGRISAEGSALLSGKIIPLLKSMPAPEFTIEDKVKVEKYINTSWKYNEETRQSEKTEVPAKRRIVTLLLTAGQSTASFPVQDVKDYPPIPEVPDIMPLRFADIATPISEVLYAACKEDSRPVLESVCLRQDKRAEMATSDGWRLAVAPVRMRGKIETPAPIPTEACVLLNRMKGTVSAAVTEDTNKHRVMFFSQKGLILSCHIVDGNFPDYRQIIPKKGGQLLRCDANSMRAAMKQIKALHTRNEIVRLRTKGHTLLVTTEEDGNQICIKIPCKGRAKVAYNPNFLSDLLDKMNGTFEIRNDPKGTGPGIVKIGGTLHIVMPKSIQW